VRAFARAHRGRRLGGDRRPRRVPALTRLVVIGPSGSGKTRLSALIAARLDIRHVEIDALWHGPNWQSCSPEELRARVAAATEDHGWVSDGTYHTIIGDLVLERAETVAWLDLPVPLVMWRLVKRSWTRKRSKVELWNGNVEAPWIQQVHWLFWPAFKRAFENRRALPERFARHPHLSVHRLRSDAAVERFAQSIQAAATTSASSTASERQNTPPSVDT
jgi:adenylate kinase family enzyme